MPPTATNPSLPWESAGRYVFSQRNGVWLRRTPAADQRRKLKLLEADLRIEVEVLLLAAGAAGRGSEGALRDYQASAAAIAAMLLSLGSELDGLQRQPAPAVIRRLALLR